MRQQSIHVPLFSTKGQNEESERTRENEVKENLRYKSREGKERESKRVSETVSHLLVFATKAMLESFARLVGMPGLHWRGEG